MLEFVPDLPRLTMIFSQATAPTFFLGAVAGFVSLMSSRLSAVVTRIRGLNGIPGDDPARAHLKTDIDRLRRRARLLNRAIVASLVSGICATILLAIVFTSEFFGLKYAYGAGLLFVVATLFLGAGLVSFAQEARIGLSEADEYE
ncbi:MULTISPECIES: DUF2721 domain-containing protein [Methylocystis]|uniref:DUF2721 domain-containing protein n=1 Tax=Methylocystis iwaonis TaxID=2885079 RepID=A0ABN6VL77_9HYPH|nr:MULTISPECIES: DUF2721 domain-containing protein [Methylocystis]MDJ0450924.1 DUF2721 domain-containing protein [Methylocystis sp. JR02]BDV36513.1 hypothetical protein SS37A_40430 [Methylocystis iwaonis]